MHQPRVGKLPPALIVMDWKKFQAWNFIILYLNSFLQNGSAYRDLTNDILRLNIPEPRLHINTNTICGNTEGLSRRQYQLCKQEPNAIASAIQGMQIAVHECKRQFKSNRWNCTSLETRNKIPYTSAFFKTGYREAAFSHAISSAGVAYAVAHACSLGKIEGCECVISQYMRQLPASVQNNAIRNGGNISALNPKMAQYMWGSCDHNINFGMQFSRKFLDEREPANDFHARLVLHNNRVGRLVVANNMQTRCSCHGTSGSCSLRTCWKQSPAMEFVGRTLRGLYEKAFKIGTSNRANGKHLEFQIKRNLGHLDNNIHYDDTEDPNFNFSRYFGVGINSLVYFKDSPDYCTNDQAIAFGGTKGRYCDRTANSAESQSCSNLCCNRGHKTFKLTRVERCRCKFHWCCYVECDNCTITERVAVCR